MKREMQYAKHVFIFFSAYDKKGKFIDMCYASPQKEILDKLLELQKEYKEKFK